MQEPIPPSSIPLRTRRRHPLGDLPDFQRRPLALMRELADEYPPLTRIRLGPQIEYVLSDPDGAAHVLQSNSRNYLKEQQMMDQTRQALLTGRNLFTSDGEPWLWRRRAMQPSFHRRLMAQFSAAIVDEAERIVARFQDGQPVDMEQAMLEATMGVIGRTMLTRDILADHPQLYDAFLTASDHIIYRATTVTGRFTPPFLPTARNRAFRQALDDVRTMLEDAVAQRQAVAEADRPADLLTLLMAGRDDESGFTLSREQLLDELYGIVTAGHETTSITLAALFYELARHEEAAERLSAELDQVLGARLPSVDDLPRLPYLNSAIEETMRRYPAAYVTTRQAIAEDVILGYRIPAGGVILINIYGLHHHRALWRAPDRFDPDRWTRDEINRRAFIPFGAGPRKCIGEPLAMLEMALIAARIGQRFRFQVHRPMAIRARFTLRSEDGIWLTPIPRRP